MTEPMSGDRPDAVNGGDRLAAVEQRVDKLEGHRDSLLVVTFVLSGIAVIAAIVGVGFGARAIDESKKNVKAAGTVPATAAPASCEKAAGFPDGAKVQDKGTKAASGSTVSVEAGDFFFDATCVSDTPAGTVTLTVHNGGQALHNVTIADQNIDEDVEAGQTITLHVKVGSSPVQYVCKYHRTSGMVGALLPAAS